MGFLDSSVGKESPCNAGDPHSIPGSGRSTGEGIGYSLRCSWASLVSQLVKNLPAKWETWVWSLGWEDSPEKGRATHSSILAWRIPWTVEFMGSQSIGHDWTAFTSLHFMYNIIYIYILWNMNFFLAKNLWYVGFTCLTMYE